MAEQKLEIELTVVGGEESGSGREEVE